MGVRPATTALTGPPVAVHRYRPAIHLKPVAAPVTAAIVLTSSRWFLDAATARSMAWWFARHDGAGVRGMTGPVCAAWRGRCARHGGAVCAAWRSGLCGMEGGVRAWQASARSVTSRCPPPGIGPSTPSFRAQFQVVKPISSLYLRGIFSDCIFSFKATAI